MPLDEWQEQALEAAMGERSDGRWASKFVGISAPRQNGKSQLIVARALAGILLFGEKMIIISAHETDTAREIWKRLIDVVEDNPSVEARVTGRMDAVNREFLSFGKGSERQTIKLKARRAGGSRGFSADCLLLDEAQILGKQSWGSIVPTMSAMPNPQLWLFGTPPTETDDPFAFSRVRESATAKRARHCWLEWAAEPGDDFDDADTWAKANPAYGVRISYEACADDRAAMDDAQFGRERLGMWDADAGHRGIIPMDAWKDRADSASRAVDNLALAVEVGPDLAWASVSLAGQRADGDWHLELIENRNGAAWMPAYVAALLEMNPALHGVVVDVGGPIKSMVTQKGSRYILDGPEIQLTALTVNQLATACTKTLDGVITGWLHHIDQPQLTAAVQAAGKRMIGDTGTWVFSRKSTTSDITPVQSATYALWGAMNTDKLKRPRSARVASGTGRAYVARKRAVRGSA